MALCEADEHKGLDAEIFGLLGEELQYAGFFGRGCVGRAGKDDRDPYEVSLAALIRHVYQSGKEYYDRVVRQKTEELYAEHWRTERPGG